MPRLPLLADAHALVLAPLERRVIGPARAELLAAARGRVLEVGAGTGANLAWYPTGVEELHLCEPSDRRRARLERRVASRPWPFPVTVHAAPAEGPLPPGTYDTVVSTFVLCRAADPAAVAAALRGAMADAGSIAYLEHVHAGGLAGRLQRLLAPRWRGAGGCDLARPPTEGWRSVGLVPVEQRWLRLPPPLHLALAGRAVVRRRPPVPTERRPAPATVPL